MEFLQAWLEGHSPSLPGRFIKLFKLSLRSPARIKLEFVTGTCKLQSGTDGLRWGQQADSREGVGHGQSKESDL